MDQSFVPEAYDLIEQSKIKTLTDLNRFFAAWIEVAYHQKVLQYMMMTRSIGCVTGEIGCGKSTAIRALKDRLDANKYNFIYLSDANLKPRDFYRELLHHFGLPAKFSRGEAKRQFQHLVVKFKTVLVEKIS